MGLRTVNWLLVIAAVVAMPVIGFAQEAAVGGKVTDSTGGVLPGVVVRAVNEATGNNFETVTDGAGTYRLALRVGVYRVTAELGGFTTVTRTGVQVLVGQEVPVNLQMVPATLAETVTVTGEAPLVDTTSSTLGSNIDPKQMQEIPLNSRNWMDLALLAPGSRQNASSGIPESRQGFSQVNIDGQQVTNLIFLTNPDEPSFSRDAIGEFQIITNRFDATKGRSAGMTVNAITKSGTNTYAGTLSGFFRHDRLNAADFIQRRVIPYSNQQVSTTFGGPIRKDRVHFFGNYEYEREPQTRTYNSPFPSFNVDQKLTRRDDKGLARLDAQFTARTRLSVRGAGYRQSRLDGGGGATNHPSTTRLGQRFSREFQATETQVIGTSAVNEIKGGYAYYDLTNDALTKFKGKCNPFPEQRVRCGGSPTVTLIGYSIGSNVGQDLSQTDYSIRDDFSFGFSRHGRHDMKLGGEYYHNLVKMWWCANCTGSIVAIGGPIPSNIESLFLRWDDWSTWNLAGLSPITRRVDQQVSNTNFRYNPLTHLGAGWLQDDWQMSRRLTLNLGVRWDLQMGAFSEKLKLQPWLPGNLPYDTNNFAPRLGFAFAVTDKTVLRGGYGKFFTQSTTDEAHQTLAMTISALVQTANDGRPDFAANPYNGPVPTLEQVIARACDQNFTPTCVRRGTVSPEINLTPRPNQPYAHQASVGVQRQLGTAISVEADYVYTGGRLEETSTNINLTYNPATGANYPFSDISHRPFPRWGDIHGATFDGRSNYHALQTSFTKRFSDRWQGSATYTLGVNRDGDPLPWQYSLADNDTRLVRRRITFPLARDMGGEYGYAVGDQRHRAVFNGIWDMGYRFQLSGLYFYGSGERFFTNYGGDLRDAIHLSSPNGGTGRLRPNGTVVPRNNLIGNPIHRVDARIQRSFPLGGRRSIDLLAEVFNLFNHANYGSYTTQESNRQYGRPSFNTNIAYQPRTGQLGFRLAF